MKNKLIKLIALLLVSWNAFSSTSAQAVEGKLLENYPGLNKFVFNEPKSHFYLGLSVTPIGILKNKVHYGFSIFQFHWIYKYFDVEIFSGGLNFSQSKNQFASSRQFLFRSVPKVRLFGVLSIGPLIGYEFVNFPKVVARLRKGDFVTPFEGFSSRGLVYGASMSQGFQTDSFGFIRISQTFYKQTYSVEKSLDNWDFEYQRQEFNDAEDIDQIAPAWVLAFEIATLF